MGDMVKRNEIRGGRVVVTKYQGDRKNKVVDRWWWYSNSEGVMLSFFYTAHCGFTRLPGRSFSCRSTVSGDRMIQILLSFTRESVSLNKMMGRLLCCGYEKKYAYVHVHTVNSLIWSYLHFSLCSFIGRVLTVCICASTYCSSIRGSGNRTWICITRHTHPVDQHTRSVPFLLVIYVHWDAVVRSEGWVTLLTHLNHSSRLFAVDWVTRCSWLGHGRAVARLPASEKAHLLTFLLVLFPTMPILLLILNK